MFVAPGSTPDAWPGPGVLTVAIIWAVVIGVMRVVIAFELKRLPEDVAPTAQNGAPRTRVPVAQS